MEKNVLTDEEQVTLHLIVEFVRDLNTAHMVGARLGPLATHFAGLNNVRNELQDSL